MGIRTVAVTACALFHAAAPAASQDPSLIPLGADQTVECSLQAGEGALDRGTCRGWGAAVLEIEVTPRPRPAGGSGPAGSQWAVSFAAAGAPGIRAAIEAQDGAMAPARTLKAPFGWFPVDGWQVHQGRIRAFSFNLSRPSPPTEVDRRILRHAAGLLADGEQWDRGTDRACSEPTGRLTLYCGLRKASLDLTNDFHHRRPALRLVREAIQRRFAGRIKGHTLADFNGHPETTIQEILEILGDASSEPGARSSTVNSDATHPTVAGLDLPSLPRPVDVHYSRGYEVRATALQRGARALRELLIDSVGVRPADLALLVLDESDWLAVTELPYGLHTLLLDDPPAFLAPALVDRGIYYDSTLATTPAELGVDLIGLHYLAHFFAAEALYTDGHAANPPVKWLDEVFTLMLEDILRQAVDPDLEAASAASEAESLRLTDPRITTLDGFDAEYRRYFVTPEGAPNYAWFVAGLAGWSREIHQDHGITVLRRVRDAIATAPAEIDTEHALELLELKTPPWTGNGVDNKTHDRFNRPGGDS